MAAKMYANKAFMTKRYNFDKKTPEEIAKECGCSVQTVYVYLESFGLKKKGRR
jgi:hypothetical protein